MASRRLTPVMKPLAPPNPAPRRRARHVSLFRGRRSMRAAADQEPRSPRVNCTGQVRAAAGGGSPDYACFCIPASTATSKLPFKWLSLLPFRRDRRRQVSEETTTATVVKDERARYLVRPPGEVSTSCPPANALVLMRCRSVDPKSKLSRSMARRRVWKGWRVIPDMMKETTSQVQDVCDDQDGPGCSSSLCTGSEEEVD